MEQRANLKYEAIKVNQDEVVKIADEILVEAPLQININHKSFTVVMRTPGADRELSLGLLVNEGVLKKGVEYRIYQENENILDIEIREEDLGSGYLNARSLLSVSSCGICGKQSLEDLHIEGYKNSKKQIVPKPKSFENLFTQLREHQTLFEKTGGSHAAALFDENQELYYIFEDIGRHNAVDKICGAMYLKKTKKKPTYLVVSGRVSYEIVSKAFFSKIPVILSVSACSSMAIDMAKELGITLIGFNRGKQATFYS